MKTSALTSPRSSWILETASLLSVSVRKRKLWYAFSGKSTIHQYVRIPTTHASFPGQQVPGLTDKGLVANQSLNEEHPSPSFEAIPAIEVVQLLEISNIIYQET